MPQHSHAICNSKYAKCTAAAAGARRLRCWQFAIGAAILWLATACAAIAQEEAMPGMEPTGMDYGAAPVSDFGGVSYFSQDLGTMLRLRYNTESFGQNDHGNFDVGTMQMLTFDDWATFVDGQVTMNDVQGVGFNVGTGIRWLAEPPHALGAVRMEGVSIWADGTSTREGNFFPQIGVSYESLGESWDFRANGYTPLGPQDKLGDFVPTGEIGLFGNSVGQLTQAVINSSLHLAELEVARRLGAERDAWAFAGPYYLANDDLDSTGYRIGVRGYAYPDLLLQFAVSDDELFHTNATFSIVWFVGRTRTDFQPACGVPDRFREPVMRNDYVVLAQSTAVGGIPFTDANGDEFRIVHVNGNTTTPGVGTFESPLAEQQVDEVQNFSQPGDIILAWAESEFFNEGTVQLQDNQRFLGEGGGIEHIISTTEGNIAIPETSPGARDATRPLILAAIGDVMDAAVLMADSNIINNFTIDGDGTTLRAIVGSEVTGTSTLGNLDIRETTTSGLSILDNSDVNLTATSTVTFTDIAGRAVEIDGDTDGDATDEDQINGTINIAGEIFSSVVDTEPVVFVQDLGAGANIDFTGRITQTAGGGGISVTSNTAGATTDFTGRLVLRTGGNIAFNAQNAGTLAVTNTGNELTTTTGQIVRVTDTAIAATGFNIAELNRSIGATERAIELNSNTGGPITLGVPGGVFGDSGTIFGGDDGGNDPEDHPETVLIRNSANVTLSSLIIINADDETGIFVDKTNDNAMTVNLNDLRVTAGARGLNVESDTATGAITMTVNDSEIRSQTAFGMRFENVDNGTIQVNDTIFDGNIATTSGAGNGVGVLIKDSNASFTFDSNPANDNTIIREWGFKDFEVDNGTPTITFNGAIENTDGLGRSVHVHDIDGGNVNFTANSSITDQGFGMTVEDNGAAQISFLGTNIFNTSSTAITIDDNDTGGTNANITLAGLTINTTGAGRGLVATAGGTLSVTGTTNTINTDNGAGLTITDMNIGSVDFASVTVDGPAAVNGIILRNLTGGQVEIGTSTGADGTGGTISTTGTAIEITNAANVALHELEVIQHTIGIDINLLNTATTAMSVTLDGVDVADFGGDFGLDVDTAGSQNFTLNVDDSTFQEEVDMDLLHSGEFTMLFEDSTINTGEDSIAFSLTFDGAFTDDDADVTIQRNNVTTGNETAFLLFSPSAIVKTINFLMQDNTFQNTSAQTTVDIESESGTLLNATILDNTFTNSGGGEGFFIEAENGGDVVLNLGGNTSDVYRLREEAGSNFTVFERTATIINETRNTGPVITDPNDAAFTEAPTAPPTP
jgi:hypothetical protein